MDLKEFKITDTWELYDKGYQYNQQIGMYEDTDKNFRMYQGNQWEGLIRTADIEPVQLNFIKPIVKYKVNSINANLYMPKHSTENFDNQEFLIEAESICKLLDKRASKIWEKDRMDKKIKLASRNSAVNDECPTYVRWDDSTKLPINEIISKNDVIYGDENCEAIQEQPYIIIRQRVSLMKAIEIIKKYNVSKEKLDLVVGDKTDVLENAGDSAKLEKDDKVTILTKLWKENGHVYFSKSTKYLEFKKSTNSGMHLYPLAHMIWESKEGYARGSGEVRWLIPNQIENNKTLMRRLITIKTTAYQQKVVNADKISNVKDINKIGSILVANGFDTQDVSKLISYIQPAQMSPDVDKMFNEMISLTRDLAGAGDIASGNINPETASGKAILAVQNASKQPLNEHLANLKDYIEDLSRIWFDMQSVYAKDSLELEEEYFDETLRKNLTRMVKINKKVLDNLKVSIKVDVTPKGPYDQYAQEISLENLFKAGYFNIQKLPELEAYVSVLDDDANMPKKKLEKYVEKAKKEQQKIQQIEQENEIRKARISQFLNSDENVQAGMMNQIANQNTIN